MGSIEVSNKTTRLKSKKGYFSLKFDQTLSGISLELALGATVSEIIRRSIHEM